MSEWTEEQHVLVRAHWRKQWFGSDPEKPPLLPRPPEWDTERERWRGWVYVTGPGGAPVYVRTVRRRGSMST